MIFVIFSYIWYSESMTIYWKPWHSLEDRKEFLWKIVKLSCLALGWVIILDAILILYFWAELWKIVIWSLLVLLLRKNDIIWIIKWFIEIRRIENNIDKWLLWENKVAEVLNKLAHTNNKICVFHDVFMWHENIDHIVVYDNKIVIIIETKSYSEFPYGLYLKRLNYQIRRQWNFLHKETWLYIHPIGVFTEAFVEPFKQIWEISYINISYLERKIEKIVQLDWNHDNKNAIQKILITHEKYHSKKLSYLDLLFAW